MTMMVVVVHCDNVIAANSSSQCVCVCEGCSVYLLFVNI